MLHSSHPSLDQDEVNDPDWDMNAASITSKSLKPNNVQISSGNGKVSILTLNVNGLKGKLKSPDFENYITQYNFVCILESKLGK